MPAARSSVLASEQTLEAALAHARFVREEIYRTGVMPDSTGRSRPVWPVGLTKARGEALRDVARSCRATRILEAGLGLAMSSSYLLDAAISTLSESGASLDRALAAGTLLTSIDPGETINNADAGLIHLRDAGLARFHRFIDDRSELALPALIRAGETFDLVFIDGDHRFDAAMVDTFFALRLVKAGGVIVLDDAWMPAVAKASNFFVSNGLCERVSVFVEGGKERLHTLRPRPDLHDRAWDHFVDF